MKVEYNGQDLSGYGHIGIISQPPDHANCKSELHTFKPITMTYRPPTAKELTLEIMPLVVKRTELPLWRVIKRFKISVEIERLTMQAMMLGYFKIKK